ncbi:MAG: branched-chain amino acid transporter permease [Acidimicrobiales bacterium]|nr:branched-chain amino acid transporter permease [Acidimicrobiales bacterium]
MELFLQRLTDGISSGAIYAALALAIVLIYRSTEILNFAQGEMAMFSTFVVWWLSKHMPIIPAVLLGMALSFAAGMVIERVVIRPVEDKSPLVIVIVTIGLFTIFTNAANLIFGTNAHNLDSMFPKGTIHAGQVTIDTQVFWLLAVLVLVSILLYLLFQKTKLGLAMRAAAANPESSRMLGVPVGRMLMVGWGLAAALGALAGALVASSSGLFLTSSLMQGVLIYAFAAATLGGFDSPAGAVVGGLTIGVVKAMAGGYISWIGNDMSLAVAFAVILGVLLLRPNGLFGRVRVERV